MHRFFGTPNRAPKPTMSDAIAGNETRIASIEVQIKKLDGELQKFKDQMARMKNGPGKSAVQQRALRVLQQKKQYEAQMASIQQQTFNMESTMVTTENLRNTMITVDAMKAANKQMKKEFGKVDINQIDSLNDEMQDLLEQANEVQEALGRSYAVPDEIDEEELQAELDALSAFDENETEDYLAEVTQPQQIDTSLLEEHGIQQREQNHAMQANA